MQRQNDFWFASFFIAILMQTCLLAVVSTKDAATTKKNIPLQAGNFTLSSFDVKFLD